ncbi:MAG: ABC transporter substrate-binding protein [Actinomycetota bacterium]|nr:ABC transporter substrate-binding protein [Actinomycetota bacterium]
MSDEEPIRSFEFPRRWPGLPWQRRRIEEQMEELSASGLDTPMNRREFLDASKKMGLSVAATAWLYPAFLAACGRTAEQQTPYSGGRFDVGGESGGETINIGVISIYSGVGAFVGKLVDHGAVLAVDQINKHGLPTGKKTPEGFPDFDAYQKQTTGGILGGKRINLIKRDDNLSAQVAVSALQEMVTRYRIKGLIFAGLYDDIYACKKLAQQYNIPCIAAYGDLYSVDQLYPKTDYKQLFQMFPPDVWGIEIMLEEYATKDRGYKTFGYLGDNTAVGAQGKRLIGETLAKLGLHLSSAEQYNVGDVDMTAQLSRAAGGKPNVQLIWGIAGDTAHALESLQRLDANYKDHETALHGPGWHPQIIGFEGGAAERTFAVLAGEAARTGTMSYWYQGGIGYIPQFQKAVDIFKQHFGTKPTGGENNPADAVFLFAHAFEQAKGTDADKVIAALENTSNEGGINFSSIAPHTFSADRHISLEKDDMVGITLERGAAAPTNPAYDIGTEFKQFFSPGYVGPTQFMRFNQEGLMRKHKDLYGEIMLKNGYGTQCTKVPDSRAPYGFKLTNACKIH